MNNDPHQVLEKASSHLVVPWEKKNLDGMTFKELKSKLERSRKVENLHFVLLILVAVMLWFAITDSANAGKVYIAVLYATVSVLLAITGVCIFVHANRQHKRVMRETTKYNDAVLKCADDMRKLNPLDYVGPDPHFYSQVDIKRRLVALAQRVLELEDQFLYIRTALIIDVESVMSIGHDLRQARSRIDDMFDVLPDFDLDFGTKEAIFRLAKERMK